jgi:hypothetical protein
MDEIKLNDSVNLKDFNLQGLTRGDLPEELRNKIVEHRIEMEDKKINNTWESCCLTLDRRAVQYFTQHIIIVGIMGFSIVMLLSNGTCEGQQAYLGLLTLLIGLIIPNPKFKDSNEGD